MSERKMLMVQGHEVPFYGRYYTYTCPPRGVVWVSDRVLYMSNIDGPLKPGQRVQIGGYSLKVIERDSSVMAYECTPSRWTWLHRRTRVILRNGWVAFSSRVIATLVVWGIRKRNDWY